MPALYIGRSSSYSRIIRAFAHEYEQITATVQASLHTHFQLPLPMLVRAAAQFVGLAPCTVGALSRGGPGCSSFGAHLACPPFRQHWDASLASHRLARLATWPSTRTPSSPCLRWSLAEQSRRPFPPVSSRTQQRRGMHYQGDHFIQTQNYQMFIHTVRYSVSAFPTGQMQTKQNKTQSGQQQKKRGERGDTGIEAEATG